MLIRQRYLEAFIDFTKREASPEVTLVFWKLFQIGNLERLWVPSRGKNLDLKYRQLFEPSLRPVRLRIFRGGRFH